jgi:uncharacterized coiled-coil protein SlyX
VKQESFAVPPLPAAPSPNAEARLLELEVRYTHLERQFADLSAVVFEQQKVLDQLQRHLGAVRGRLEELGEPVSNDRPPHY